MTQFDEVLDECAKKLDLTETKDLFFWRPFPVFELRRPPMFSHMLAAKSMHAVLGCVHCLWAGKDDNAMPCELLRRSFKNATPEQLASATKASDQLRETRRVNRIWNVYRSQQEELHERPTLKENYYENKTEATG